MHNHYAIILCGGSGTRLWPLSRKSRPKQLLHLNGDKSLLQQTAERLIQYVPKNNLFTVTHEDHKYEVKGQIADIAPEAIDNVLAEPYAKNTLPAIAWAVDQIYKKDSGAMIGVFASDHAIDNEPAFLDAWKIAEEVAKDDYLVLLGIKPHEPSSGYGYIKPGDKNASAVKSVFEVDQFVEKPDVNKAKQYVENGYLWNSGMFIFKAKAFKQMFKEHQPEMAAQFETMNDENFIKTYKNFTNISIDYGLAEKANKVAVVPADMSWSDLGNWDSIYQKQKKDANKNVVQGEVFSEATKNSLLFADSGVLAISGLDNIIVVQTEDATLVCDRDKAEDIKSLVTSIKKTKPELTDIHMTVHRPWGTYSVLEESTNFKIKRIVVKHGNKLSLQMHHHRSEHWVVVSGKAFVTNDEQSYFVSANESTYIPAGCKHRLENKGKVDLVMIEVQCGSYVGEDDIVRFEDSYGRMVKNKSV